METLVAVAPHRNHQYYDGGNRSRRGVSNKFRSFGSASSGGYYGVNCRSFESGVGLLPTPLKTRSPVTPFGNKSFNVSPRTPSPPSANESHKGLKRSSSSMNTTPIKIDFENKDDERIDFEKCFSERWAGPAYSNSPPPSSLPVPKFSMRPKRSTSLELPDSSEKFDFGLMAKSAPTSPRERSPEGDVFDGSDFATKTLRRILNLDITDE